MRLEVTDPGMLLLIGPSGSGKSTFARERFGEFEVLSSDRCRGWVSDDETDQGATTDAFALLHHLADVRLRRRRFVVVDATNVQAGARKSLVAVAKANHLPVSALVFDLPADLCLERNASRPDRTFGAHVVRNQSRDLRASLRGLEREGIRGVTVVRSPEEAAALEIVRVPVRTDFRREAGPFDLVGDVHGCLGELTELLGTLGYRVEDGLVTASPEGRRLVFLGDLVDRGPDSPGVVRLVRRAVEEGRAFCVPGNHDAKFVRWLQGKTVTPTHGLDLTMEQYAAVSEEDRRADLRFLDKLPSHLWLDGGALVAAHAGMKEEYVGRASGRVREFAMYGETTGETDEYGLPVRHPWAEEYRGEPTIVYGHTPTTETRWRNRTMCLDTGCVFGGALTALRWPEREVVSVPARRVYAEPKRPLAAADRPGWLPDAGDLTGKLIVSTEIRGDVRLPEENTRPAFEAWARFGVDPRWLVYLPPTMAPAETSPLDGWLERPEEAFAFYAAQEVGRVVCEEKHMGSRAVVIVGRDEAAVARRFAPGGLGIALTRTGRRFFEDRSLEASVLARLSAAMSGLWDELGTDWAILDAEILPWSLKAGGLVSGQYAPVGAAGTAHADTALGLLERASAPEDVLLRARRRAEDLAAYRAEVERYAPVYRGPEDVRIAPFHLLATEGRTWFDSDHETQMRLLARLAEADPTLVRPTRWISADPRDPAEAVAWWEAITAEGAEGMVVKPFDFVTRGKKGIVQPATKVRGREYLRLIYGPEYLAPENLPRLKARGLGAKRGLAVKEFALGWEALTRFVRGDGPARVFECAFGVLALETEPVDARL